MASWSSPGEQAPAKSWRFISQAAAIHYWAGLTSYTKGDWVAAATHFYQAVELEPDFPEAHTKLEESRAQIPATQDCAQCKLVHGNP